MTHRVAISNRLTWHARLVVVHDLHLVDQPSYHSKFFRFEVVKGQNLESCVQLADFFRDLHISHRNRHRMHRNVAWSALRKITMPKKKLKKMMDEQDLDRDGNLDLDIKIMDDPKVDDLIVDGHHITVTIAVVTITTTATIRQNNQFIRNLINQVKNQLTRNHRKNLRKNQQRNQQPTNHTNLQ